MINRRRTSDILRGTVALGLAVIIPAGIFLMILPSRTSAPMQCTDDAIYLAAYHVPELMLPFAYGSGNDRDKLSDPRPEVIDEALISVIEHLIAIETQIESNQQPISRQPVITSSFDPWAHLVNHRPVTTPVYPTPKGCSVPEPGVLWLVYSGLIIIFIGKRYGLGQ